jgi:hypothetical protein
VLSPVLLNLSPHLLDMKPQGRQLDIDGFSAMFDRDSVGARVHFRYRPDFKACKHFLIVQHRVEAVVLRDSQRPTCLHSEAKNFVC